MQREWTLIINLHQHGNEFLLEFNLLDKDRRHLWKTGRGVLAGLFQTMVGNIAGFFDYGLATHERMERIQSFRYMAGRTFMLAEFLKETDFSPADALTVNTLVTVIPWDLVPYGDDFLGHKISIGLKIPTIRLSHPLRGPGEGRPRLLHVVSNPAEDLPHVHEEVQQLKTLLESVQGVDYEPVINPTRGELIHRFSSGRNTPFFHFTGHLKPRQGLVLKDDTLTVAEIFRYFPSQREQVVFLNGCDAVYGEESEDNAGLDWFQSASVANAFLDAGAEAVIAPRSRIADREAYDAAAQVWKLIFESHELGEIVRLFRSSAFKERPDAISGYSYILYGDPSSRIRPAAATSAPIARRPQSQESNETILQNEILLEAWRDASGPIAPRHIFASLTRRWLLGQIFFTLGAQLYFLALEELRLEVGVHWPPKPPRQGQIEFTAAGGVLVNSAMSRRTGDELDDLALLEGLAIVDDAEVRCALEALELGPRTIEAVLHDARDWTKNGRRIPQAVVEPDGYLNPKVFQSGLLGTRQVPTIASIDRWDLLVELVLTNSEVTRLWISEGLRVPSPGLWDRTKALHWAQLSESFQSFVLNLTVMLTNDNTRTASVGQLLTCLADKQEFTWVDLPPSTRDWLAGQGLTNERWDALLHRMQREALAWP